MTIGREVADFHVHVFRSVHWGVEVEIPQVNGAIARYDTVEMELDFDHVNGRCATVTRVVEEIATHGDLCAVGVLLLWQ